MSHRSAPSKRTRTCSLCREQVVFLANRWTHGGDLPVLAGVAGWDPGAA